jgi:hypothetical protein
MRSGEAFGKDTDDTKLLQHDVEEEEKVLHLCHHSKKISYCIQAHQQIYTSIAEHC